jgi:hypothetical protein
LVAQIVVTPTTYDHAHDGALHIKKEIFIF